MKILIIAFEFPPEGGGIGTYTYQIAKQLSHLEVNITVLALTNRLGDTEIASFDKNQNFRIERYKNFRLKPIAIFHRISKALFMMYKNKYDLLYLGHMPPGIIGLLGKFLLKIPYVIVGHGSEILSESRKRYRKTVYEQSEYIIVNSEYTKNMFKKFGIKAKMKTIFPGGDHLHFNSKNVIQLKLKNTLGLKDKFVLLTVGSLSERKDHETVLRAINMLGSKTNQLHYLIVGTGPLESKLKSLADELKIKNKVTFFGYAKLEELPSIYDACDLFILNSKIDRWGDVEGFGIVLIEANLMGKAVIGTKGCGMVEAIEDGKTGILVNMDDPEQTANAILKLYTDRKLLEEMGNYGRARALNYFTWLKSGEETKQLLINKD